MVDVTVTADAGTFFPILDKTVTCRHRCKDSPPMAGNGIAWSTVGQTVPGSLPVRWPAAPSREWAWGGSTGRGVRVCVVDSGIEHDHPSVGPVDGAVAVESREGGGSRVVRDEQGDVGGHGTACASVIRRFAPDCVPPPDGARLLGAQLGRRELPVAVRVGDLGRRARDRGPVRVPCQPAPAGRVLRARDLPARRRRPSQSSTTRPASSRSPPWPAPAKRSSGHDSARAKAWPGWWRNRASR